MILLMLHRADSELPAFKRLIKKNPAVFILDCFCSHVGQFLIDCHK